MMFSFQHFTLIVGYRRPVGFGNWRDTLAEWLHSLGQKPWIVVGDFSDDIHNGDISNIWNSAFGTLISSAAHERGSHDIDAIVVSPQLSHHLDRFKPRPYHEVLAAQVSIQYHSQGPLPIEMRLAAHRRRTNCEPPVTCTSWQAHAVSQQNWESLLRNQCLGSLWQTWSQDAENWLVQAGRLVPQRGDVALGTVGDFFGTANERKAGSSGIVKGLRGPWLPGSHFLYMDDRTSFLSNQLYVNQVLEFWRQFAEISHMKNNNTKTEIWELQNPRHHGFVLGMTLATAPSRAHRKRSVTTFRFKLVSGFDACLAAQQYAVPYPRLW